MMSVTRLTDWPRSRSIVAPASSTSALPASTLLDRVADQRLDLLGRVGAALRQAAHFGGHHGKAAALLAGARGFHRRVQRQDVGLEGDAVDTPMMSAILRELSLIGPWSRPPGPPRRRPSAATSDGATGASWLACRALSAFCFTVVVSSSIEAAVSSSAVACSSVRCDRSGCPRRSAARRWRSHPTTP